MGCPAGPTVPPELCFPPPRHASYILLHKHRWRSLKVTVDSNTLPIHELSDLIQGPAPTLRSVEIVAQGERDAIDLFPKGAPSLRYLRLAGLQPRVPIKLGSDLRTLELRGAEYRAFMLNRFSQTLEACPNLESLKLQAIFPGANPQETSFDRDSLPIVLPRLTTLALEFIQSPHLLLDIIGAIEIPNCQSLTLQHSVYRDSSANAIRRVLSRMCHHLAPMLQGNHEGGVTIGGRYCSWEITGNDGSSRQAFISLHTDSGPAAAPIQLRPHQLFRWMIEDLKPILGNVDTSFLLAVPHNKPAETCVFDSLSDFPNITEVAVRSQGWTEPLLKRLGAQRLLWPRLKRVISYPRDLVSVQAVLAMVTGRYGDKGWIGNATSTERPTSLRKLCVWCEGTHAAGGNVANSIAEILGKGVLKVDWYQTPPKD